MQRSRFSRPSPVRSFSSLPALVATVLALATSPARALTYWDEVTFYLTYASFTPGDTVSSTFTFGTKPALDLSSFEFTLTWDNPLASPVASGPGSVADWASVLGAKGSVNYGFAGSQSIKGAWSTDPLGGTANLISTDYATPVRTTFSFETNPALKVPFVISIELTNIKDATGDTVDTGSGFINWATLTPVPEPAGWACLAFGLAALATLRRPSHRNT